MKLFIKHSSIGRGVFFLSIISFFLLAAHASAEDKQQFESVENSDSSESTTQDLSTANSEHLLILRETLGFLESEGRFDEFNALSLKLVSSRDSAVIEKIVNFYVAHKDRVSLFNFLKLAFEGASCKDKRKVKNELCLGLITLWKNNLDSILFFENSPGKLLKAQQLIEKKDCAQAGLVIQELEGKEGFSLPIVDTHIRIAECQKNQELQGQLEQRRQEMRVISGEI